jgi:hypothetical protein
MLLVSIIFWFDERGEVAQFWFREKKYLMERDLAIETFIVLCLMISYDEKS